MSSNPYRTPTAVVADLDRVGKFANPNFKDPTALTKWTVWFLYAQIAVSVAALVSGALEYRLLMDFKNGAYSASEELATTAAASNDLRQQVVAGFQTLIYLVSGILILMWIYRANFNARGLGALNMKFTPGWSVGWYFVPFANLWKPYQSMKEIWKTSADPLNWETKPVSAILPWWWFLLIVSNVLGNASFQSAIRAQGIEELIIRNVVIRISDFVTIPLCYFFLIMVEKIHGMQMSHVTRRGT